MTQGQTRSGQKKRIKGRWMDNQSNREGNYMDLSLFRHIRIFKFTLTKDVSALPYLNNTLTMIRTSGWIFFTVLPSTVKMRKYIHSYTKPKYAQQ